MVTEPDIRLNVMPFPCGEMQPAHKFTSIFVFMSAAAKG